MLTQDASIAIAWYTSIRLRNIPVWKIYSYANSYYFKLEHIRQHTHSPQSKLFTYIQTYLHFCKNHNVEMGQLKHAVVFNSNKKVAGKLSEFLLTYFAMQ